MTSLRQDVTYALRMFARSPGFTAIAVLTLALGIGANTTIFSWVNATLLDPIPGLARPSEVMALSLGKTQLNAFPFTYPDFEALRDGQQSFSGLTATYFIPMSLTGRGKPERVWGMLASANYFDVLGVRPILGRGFLPAEGKTPGGAPVAVVSYQLWQRRFGANPSVVGRIIDINRHPYTLVGVAPRAFQGSQTGLRLDIWIPLMMEPQLAPEGDLLHDHHYFWLTMLGRLKPGVATERAGQEMTHLLQREVRQYPEEHKGHDRVTLFPLWRGPNGANAYFSLLLSMLMAIAGVVLLLACTNVANLLLVHSVGRRREIAIRLSLGATRRRLVGQFLTESILLALAGGAVAMLITTWSAGTFMSFLPAMDFPIGLDVTPDRRVLFAALIISLFTGLIFGILPALRASAEAPVAALKEDTGSASGGRRKGWLASAFVVGQVSLSVLLLICAGLFIRSFLRAQHVNPGFNERNVLVASYDLFPAGYSPAAGIEFDRQVLARVESLPGAQSVALASRLPLGITGGGSTSVKPEGYVWPPNESREVPYAIVSPNYLKTMQIPLLEGREFSPQDTLASQRVAIVNEAFVNRFWPHQEPVGKQFQEDLTNESFVVVGVARNSMIGLVSATPQPFLYLPLYQIYRAGLLIHVRTAGDPIAFAPALERAIRELNAELPVFEVSTLQETQRLASFSQRIAGTFVGVFGLLALVIAAVGIYGVTAYATRQRTQEIGIRMAVGADKMDILRLVLGHGFRLTLIGVAAGLAASLALTRFLVSLLFGVSSTDVATFAAVALLLGAVALVASWIPARRAMRIDPLAALRYQ